MASIDGEEMIFLANKLSPYYLGVFITSLWALIIYQNDWDVLVKTRASAICSIVSLL